MKVRQLLQGVASALVLMAGFAGVAPGFSGAIAAQQTAVQATAPEAGRWGLYAASDFRLVDGRCGDCATMRQALWYFENDTVGVPVPTVSMSGFTPRALAQDDVRQWHASAKPAELQARPQLVWIGASQVLSNAQLDEKGQSLRLSNDAVASFRVVPKIKTNLSYFDESSLQFFRGRPLRMRGEWRKADNGPSIWEARTIWPQDWRIDAQQMTLRPLGSGESLAGLVRQHKSARDERFETRLLWARDAGKSRDWSRHAVVALMLNGAQGDDDEAHGGHFAIATGLHGNGQWSDWMVNNFYNLDSFSEKGIVASMLPMDNYMADLNSGQSYYRPSYMLVAVLKSDRAAHAYQGAISRVFNHLYRHDFHYRHASANCAGISMDTLRSLGWDIPQAGPTSLLKATAAYPYKALTDASFASGQQAFDYLSAEQTRLYPAAAFDAAGQDLLRMVSAGHRANAGALEKVLHEDIEALVFVRIPQIPSSRAFGSYPVWSIDEYMQRVPEDKSQWKIVPVEPRPFPAALRTPDTLSDEPLPPWVPAAVALLVLAGLIAGYRIQRGRKMRKNKNIN